MYFRLNKAKINKMICKIPPKYHDLVSEIIVTMFLRVRNTFIKRVGVRVTNVIKYHNMEFNKLSIWFVHHKI